MEHKFSKEQIEEILKNSTEEIVNDDSKLIDEFGNTFDVDEVTNIAEACVQKKYPKVNFRWSEFEIKRAKKIAAKLGLPYQTYIKSLLKRGMDNDENRLQM